MDFDLIDEIKIQDDLFDARYHPNKENLIAVASIGGHIYLIDNGEINCTLRKHHKGSSIRRIRFTKNGHLLSVAKTVKIYDMQASNVVSTLKRGDNVKTTFNAVLALSSDIVCAGDDAGSVFVWDTRKSTEKPIFTSSDCEQYISDIDGKYESRRMFVCTSGEGTLTAYDLRANKMIEPQSELFEAGFQCVKMVDLNKKVVIGGEDGAVYVFNQDEWAHTSGKFPICDDSRNRGKCSIECIDLIHDRSIFLIACSDGKIRSLTLWPHMILGEKAVCKKRSLECLQVNPMNGKSELLVGGENYINLLKFEEKPEDELNETSDDHTSDSDSLSPDETSNGAEVSRNNKQQSKDSNGIHNGANTDDYLNIFSR